LPKNIFGINALFIVEAGDALCGRKKFGAKRVCVLPYEWNN